MYWHHHRNIGQKKNKETYHHRWIPLTKGQLGGNNVHAMTSSFSYYRYLINSNVYWYDPENIIHIIGPHHDYIDLKKAFDCVNLKGIIIEDDNYSPQTVTKLTYVPRRLEQLNDH